MNKKMLAFLLILVVSIGVVTAIEYPTIKVMMNFIFEVIIPESVNAGDNNVGDEFKFMEANISTSANGGWLAFEWTNSTGIHNSTIFWVDDPHGTEIDWDITETVNISDPIKGVYEFYAKGIDIGRATANLKIMCASCNITQGNTTYNYD